MFLTQENSLTQEAVSSWDLRVICVKKKQPVGEDLPIMKTGSLKLKQIKYI